MGLDAGVGEGKVKDYAAQSPCPRISATPGTDQTSLPTCCNVLKAARVDSAP
jgi:hypothetical protein